MAAADRPAGPVRRVCLFARSWSGGLGDLVMVNVFLQVLRRAYPQAEITHVVEAEIAAGQADFLARYSFADKIVGCPDERDDDLAHWDEFFARVRPVGYDCVIFDPVSQRLAAKGMAECGVGIRIGIASGAPGEQYLTSAISIPPSLGCTPDYLAFAQALAGALGVELPAGEAAVPWFRFTPVPVPVPPSPVVAVHPGGERLWNRRWPLARFGELCRKLAAEDGASLVLLGPADERAELAELAGRTGGDVVRVCAGESLDTVASWLVAADVLVGNDSALAHIAAALQTPTVVLYGPSGNGFLWQRLYPRQQGIHGHATCQPVRDWPPPGEAAPPDDIMPCAHSCHFKYVSAAGPYPRCMTAIGVAEVHAAVREALAAQPERSASGQR